MSEPSIIDATSLAAEWALPEPPADSNKHGRGTVVVIGGDAQTPGAVLLAGLAAMRVGAGRLQIATAEPNANPLAVAIPEAAVTALTTTKTGSISKQTAGTAREAVKDADAVLIGPGMTDPEATLAVVEGVLGALPPSAAIVMDALALTCGITETAAFRAHASRMVITPNPTEITYLLGKPAPDGDADGAGRVAASLDVVSIYGSAIATPNGRTWQTTNGNVGLATSGSGDVLAGIVTGLLARGSEMAQAALWAVFLHASAGDRLAQRIGPLGFLARELLDELPGVLRDA